MEAEVRRSKFKLEIEELRWFVAREGAAIEGRNGSRVSAILGTGSGIHQDI